MMRIKKLSLNKPYKPWQFILWISVIATMLLVFHRPGVTKDEENNIDINTPEGFVRTITDDVMRSIKSNPSIQQGDTHQLAILVNEKILPHTDIQKTTQLVMGHYWKKATPQQQQELIEQFKDLLFYIYAGALSQVQNQQIQFKPARKTARLSPQASDAVVRTEVINNGHPIQLDYHLEKTDDSWKVYDLNIGGIWVVQNFRQQFDSEISRMGIDGLIQKLKRENQQRASGKKAQ